MLLALQSGVKLHLYSQFLTVMFKFKGSGGAEAPPDNYNYLEGKIVS